MSSCYCYIVSFYAVSNFPVPNVCQISWPIQIDDTETPVATDISFYKKNLPNIPDGAVYIVVFIYLTSNAGALSFGKAIDASCNSWQTFNATEMLSQLSTGVSTQTFLFVVNRVDDLLNGNEIPLSCPEIRSLFFLETDVEGALNSDFFDSGVPINVTKVLDPPTGSGMGSGDLGIGLGDQDPVPITQFFPTFSMFSQSESTASPLGVF